MVTMSDKRLKTMFLLTSVGTLLMIMGSTSAKDAYYMDSSLDCGYIGLQDLERDQAVMLYAKTTNTLSTTQLGCTISFQAVDNGSTIRIDFESFNVNSCDVKLYISGDGIGNMNSYSCGDDPGMLTSIGRTVTLTLHRTRVTATEYNFALKLTSILPFVEKQSYNMESKLDCGYVGLHDVGRDEAVMIYAKTSGTSQLVCAMTFQAIGNDSVMLIDFESFSMNNCGVMLYISGDDTDCMRSYRCGDTPNNFVSSRRIVTLILHKINITATEYNFRLKLTAVTGSTSNAVGLGNGIVGRTYFGVMFYFFIYCWYVKRE